MSNLSPGNSVPPEKQCSKKNCKKRLNPNYPKAQCPKCLEQAARGRERAREKKRKRDDDENGPLTPRTAPCPPQNDVNSESEDSEFANDSSKVKYFDHGI